MTARSSDAQTPSVATGFFQDIVAALITTLGVSCSFNDLLMAPSGSDIFNSTATWGDAIFGTNAVDVSEVDSPRAFAFAGRSSGGRKAKVFLYGMTSNHATPASYEEQPITSANLVDVRALLTSQSDFWLAIDGIKPIWYDRVTVKTNDHWVGLERV
jgi:hypothetical protein